jgi:hypothetical protein
VTDTPAPVAERYRQLLMARSGAERVRMACDMFDSARRITMAGLAGDVTHVVERRVALFTRLYGADFDAGTRERIIARIRATG